MRILIEKKAVKEILLMTLLILMSGSPVLNQPILFGGIGVSALVYSFLRLDVRKREKLWKYLCFLIIVFLAQKVVLGYISYLGSINVLAKIVFGATVMWVLKGRFRVTYLNVMYFFSVVSLLFFSLEFIGFKVPDLFHVGEERNSILIFSSLNNIDELRNCGPFWEPGAYACYLLLVPLLYIDDLRAFVANNKKKAVVLLLALVTTISTTGYICLFIIILYCYMSVSKNRFMSYIVFLPIAVAIAYIAYTRLDFMGAKIEEQTEYSLKKDGEFSNTRLGALLFDLYYIKKHPIVGNGLDERTRYADDPYLWGKSLGHGNAFSNYAAQMGIVSLIVYFALLYRAFGNKLIVPIVVALLFQGEQLMNYPLYSALPFIILPLKHKRLKRLTITLKHRKLKRLVNFKHETYSNTNDGVQP